MEGYGSLGDLLVRRLRESGQPVEEPITVAELHKVLLPYHRCRDALGYATKAEYDLALLRLLDDPDRVKIHERELAEAVEEQLESPEPGLGFLRNFAAAQLRLRVGEGEGGEDRAGSPGASGSENGGSARGTGTGAGTGEATGAAVSAAEGEGGTESPERDWLEAYEPPGGGTAPTGTEPSPAAGTASPGGRPSAGGPGDGSGSGSGEAGPSERSWEPGERCWGCERELPDRASLRFCPFCGADQTVRRCARCEEVLEPGWSYCPRCGAEMGVA